MRKRSVCFAIVVAIALPVVIAACGKPMQNKALDNPNRDDTSNMMKKAGGDDSGS